LVLKAASTVHVSMVRWAREKEKIHAALQDFISDVAPAHLPALDPSPRGGAPSASADSSLASRFRLFRQSFKALLGRDPGAAPHEADGARRSRRPPPPASEGPAE
jgi:hypothetical protein